MTSHRLEKDNQTHTTDKESAIGKYNKRLQINKILSNLIKIIQEYKQAIHSWRNQA